MADGVWWPAHCTGYVSWRSHVWTDVDPDRTGILPFVWDASFGFEMETFEFLNILQVTVRSSHASQNAL